MSWFFEENSPQALETLAGAWASPETFFWLPRKHGLDTEWFERAKRQLPDDLREGHLGLLTSGSSGQRKLVLGARNRVEALSRAIHVAQQLEPIRSAVITLPLSYSYALVNQWVWAQTHGRRARWTPGLADTSALFSVLDEETEVMLCLVGSQLPLLERAAGPRAFDAVMRVNFAGSRFPTEHWESLRRLFPRARVFTNYGCTEAMPRLTVGEVTAPPPPGFIGAPLEGVSLRVGDDEAVEFQSPFQAVAVFDGSEFQRLDGRWVQTGDTGVLEAGRVTLLGRREEVFKRYGEKVSLAQLERTVRNVWSGAFTFYVEQGVAEPGHVLVLLRPPPGDGWRVVLQGLRAQHVRAQWPVRIEAVDGFPLSGNGKVDLTALSRSVDRTVLWRGMR